MTDSSRHPHARQLLAGYAAGTVSGSGRAEVEAHLAECDDCRAELTSWQGVRAAVRQAGQGVR